MERILETLIGRIIHKKLKPDWIRYNMFSEDDIYKHIPVLVFRVTSKERNTGLIKLETCVADFKGGLPWKVFENPLSKNTNHLLTISVMESIRYNCYTKNIAYNERELLGDEMYELYCRMAIQDIPILAEHICKYFC